MNIVSEISQIQKATYCMKPFIWYVLNRQIYGDIDQWLPGVDKGGKWRVLLGYERGDKNVLELDSGDGCTSL